MRAFRHREFRLFFWGALASNCGSWVQNLAVPFVLFELTGKALWVGLAGFAQFIPSFLLGPLGGSMADRRDRRQLLLFTQTAMALTAFAMWAAWALNYRDPLLILALTALTGVFAGFTIPSWQAFVPSLVPREDLASAITLNSTQFNASRAVGPALAGILLATKGASWAFFINAVSFVTVILALWLVRPPPNKPQIADNRNIRSDFRDAIAYMRLRPGIAVSVLVAMMVAFFGNPVTQFTVVFAEDVYNAGPRVVGVLAAGVGIGAVMLAPALSTWDERFTRSSVIRWGMPLYALAVIAFGAAPTWPLGLIALLAVGGGFLAVIATSNTAVQTIVADHMRGRVMSVRVMGFTLAFPLGSLAQGVLSDLWGAQATVVVSGLLLLAGALYLFSRPALLEGLDAPQDETPAPSTP